VVLPQSIQLNADGPLDLRKFQRDTVLNERPLSRFVDDSFRNVTGAGVNEDSRLSTAFSTNTTNFRLPFVHHDTHCWSA